MARRHHDPDKNVIAGLDPAIQEQSEADEETCKLDGRVWARP